MSTNHSWASIQQVPMRDYRWRPFPYETSGFDYAGPKLAQHWRRLHGGDLEEYPEAQRLAARLGEPVGKTLATRLANAWRAFHHGELQVAFKQGSELGLAGFAVASKAVGVYAHGVEPDPERAQRLLEHAAKHLSDVVEQLPEDANAHYFHAFILGRLSQRLTVVSALAAGYAPKIEHSLQRALEIAPSHADAHLAMGLYHAEIIGKLGRLAAGVSYGASRDVALEHLDRALELNARSPTTLCEYAYALQLLFGKDKHAETAKAYQRAAKLHPADAMERMDVEKAKDFLAAVA